MMLTRLFVTEPNLWEMVDLEKKLDFAAFARGIVDQNTTEGM